jgi:hypothetical protein
MILGSDVVANDLLAGLSRESEVSGALVHNMTKFFTTDFKLVIYAIRAI